MPAFPYAFGPLAASLAALAPALGLVPAPFPEDGARDRAGEEAGTAYAFGPFLVSLAPVSGDSEDEGEAIARFAVADDSETAAVAALSVFDGDGGGSYDYLDLAGPASIDATLGLIVARILALRALAGLPAPAVVPTALPVLVESARRGTL